MNASDVRTIESDFGCRFIDVGRTPGKDYLQATPKPLPTRTISATVKSVIPGSASGVAIVFSKGEEFHAVLTAGSVYPKAGSQVSVTIENGVAKLGAVKK